MMEAGNQYSAALLATGDIRVMIRETFQAPAMIGRVSFPQQVRSSAEVRAYTRKGLLRGDDIDYGEMIHIIDGTEEGITAFTARGIESLQEFLQDVRSWPGDIRQFLIDQECNPDLIERIVADEPKS